MTTPEKRASNTWSDDEFDLSLPALGAEGDEGDGLDDEAVVDSLEDMPSRDADADPFEDACADDLPLEIELSTMDGEPSALGDDSKGLDDDHDAVALDEDGQSFVDQGGSAEEGLEFGGDDQLGLDPIPQEEDDGGLEGLEDPGGHMVDDELFPPLDGESDDDDEEVDIGIELDLPEG